jgi:hypothetical protein
MLILTATACCTSGHGAMVHVQDSERLSTERASCSSQELKEGFGKCTRAAPDHARPASFPVYPASQATLGELTECEHPTAASKPILPSSRAAATYGTRFVGSRRRLRFFLSSSSSFPCQSSSWLQSALSCFSYPSIPLVLCIILHHGYHTYRSFTQAINIGSSSRTLWSYWTCWHHKTQAQAYNYRLWCI